MQNIKLDSRLMAVASMVRQNSRLADIGTDHAYIPVYLLNEGVISEAIAADINEGPIKNADKNIASYGLSDKIKTFLSDGLKSLPENCADDIIIAGMGGILISEILESCSWVKTKNIRIIAQPMTHAEKVREFFINNGFRIINEAATEDARHKYCVIVAEYDDSSYDYPDGYIYYGELCRNKDRISKEFLIVQRDRLLKRYNALYESKSESDECRYLNKIIGEFNYVLEDM